MKWSFIVFCVYLGSLFFREERIPAHWVEALFDEYAPENLLLHVDSLSFGFRHGFHVRGLKLYDTSDEGSMSPMVSADSVAAHLFSRELVIDGLRYPRLPSGYYAPGNHEKNEPVAFELPEFEGFWLTLNRPDILAVRPERVETRIVSRGNCLSCERIHLDWPDKDEKMSIDGSCYVDLANQEIRGDIQGLAKQPHIRPLLVALDVPVSLPYFDGFTEVPGSVPSTCGWKVNLVNNDFDLWLHLRPKMGKYNSIPMQRADGRIHLHVYTRGDSLNYRQTVGPISAVGIDGQPLDGTVLIEGTNGYNTVTVKAESGLPLANLLRIGGFTGEYMGEDVVGDSKCDLQFRFPRSMTNNYEVLNGRGHIEVKNGHLMRMPGFRGLLEAMPAVAPAVSWLSDSTQASADYRIENGVLKSDNIIIEGTMYSIMMYGRFDAVRNQLDFTVRVQFSKSDSLMGKVLHPLTWPFTKLLLEFKLTGTADAPKWEYLSVVDRVMEVVR